MNRSINLKIFSVLTIFIFLTSHQNLTSIEDSEKYIIDQPSFGFFSCFLGTLNKLLYCEAHNKIPVVYWGKNSLYYVEDGFNGSQNVWEYYFEPISPGSFVCENHTYDKSSLRYIDFGKTFTHTPSMNAPRRGRKISSHLTIAANPTILHRDEVYRLITTYIKIKPIVQKKIDDFYQQYMSGKKTIGIHLRGTDKWSEAIPIRPEQIIETALGFADANTQFLIATDEKSLLHKAISILSERKVIYYDCYRSLNNNPLHGLHYIIKNDPQNSAISNEDTISLPCPAQLGEDVLVEASLLAKCDLFIHTLSNVSTAVCYLNPALENVLITGIY